MIRPRGSGHGPLMVWLRNACVWKKAWRSSVVGTLGEPLVYFLGLGYGLGTLIPPVNGESYLRYVAPGLMLSSAMYSATIEATYNSYTKMAHQRIFASMMLSPLGARDIVLGEVLWAVTKGVMSGSVVLLLSFLFGVARPWPAVLGLPLLVVAGCIFASLGLMVSYLARSYDFFNYYFTLVMAPMFFFSGIFFPLAPLGRGVEFVAWMLPLSHLVNVSRALFHGRYPSSLWGDLAWICAFGVLALWLAVSRMPRRYLA